LFVARLLATARRRRGTPRRCRALSCFWQAVAGVRWFRDRTSRDALARDHGISHLDRYEMDSSMRLRVRHYAEHRDQPYIG